MEKNTAVEALTAAKRATEEANGQTIIAVVEAARAGVSWTEIGAALGLSKQTAHARYGKVIGRAGFTAAEEVEGAAALAALQAVDARKTAEEAAATKSKKVDAPAPAPRAKRRTEAEVLANYEAHRARKATLPEICPGCDAGRWHKEGVAYAGCTETQNDHEWTDRWPLKLAKPLDGLFVRKQG